MRALLVVLFASLLALTAFGGSRVKEAVAVTNAVPALLSDGGTTDGVSLLEVEGCRVSARVTDGGTINGGVLAAYYFDSALGWVRASTALDCTLEANKLLDAGAPTVQVCPDLGTLAKYGRIAYVNKSVVNGSAAAATVTTRVECWGRNLP